MIKYDLHPAFAPTNVGGVTIPAGTTGSQSYWSLDVTSGGPFPTDIMNKQVKLSCTGTGTVVVPAPPVAISGDRNHLTIAAFRGSTMGPCTLQVTVAVWDGGTQIGDSNNAVTMYLLTIPENVMAARGASRTPRMA